MIAHILSPGGAPAVVPWLTALALFGGLLGVLLSWSDRRRRALFTALAVAGLAGTAAVYLTKPSIPQSPGFAISLAGLDGRTTTSPVAIRVCGVASGSAKVPGPGQLLLIRVDGAQVTEMGADTVALTMAPGRHRIDAVLITADHRGFQPPVAAAATVVVTGSGPIAAAPGCP
ncbi:MAG TPA: hypothetical protein VN193_11220 [Candidatus Angelobacter sp.]|nr:hypothetical protein [Candidatus Angelobacter sp.]